MTDRPFCMCLKPVEDYVHVAWTPEYMAAYRSVLYQLNGMTLAEIGAMPKADLEELVWAEMRRRGWI
ncbi:MAG: hypothetical protein WAO08_01555 [Hyphomicrobiaceae bacterium]